MHLPSKAEHWRNCIRCGVGQALLTVGLLLSVFLANTGAVSARTLEVWPGGKIQDAINAAWTDDTILVHSGTYNECLNWNSKSLHLKADVENGPVVVDAGGAWGVSYRHKPF
ncbi:MAG TPA: hypothetical protein VHR86_08965 [Armatimonadota bacterium]|nr:hypothetical protein [Armatimonadota bacterium]